MKRQNAPQQKLIAQWIDVDGKLICTWKSIDLEAKQGMILAFPTAAQAA
ncbi:hypothetical protein V2H45_09430 [Tumidithrix elongata RA019]|uniref:Uncharacterized protein n=1 Tax=Tumidithrix elongata BACA0141 TaxID=2716417 RepID=A0AAW9Q0I5_9CYAN|nr:hypothetical protein [Tumidithrix elongata RA019]